MGGQSAEDKVDGKGRAHGSMVFDLSIEPGVGQRLSKGQDFFEMGNGHKREDFEVIGCVSTRPTLGHAATAKATNVRVNEMRLLTESLRQWWPGPDSVTAPIAGEGWREGWAGNKPGCLQTRK